MYQQEIRSEPLPEARNSLAPPLSSFSNEILSEIFMDVVFDYRSAKVPWPPSMETDVLTIYRNLYLLLSVCSSWRSIMLARGAFWSVIPMITNPSKPIDKRPFQLSLQRSRGSRLCLASNFSPSEFPNFVEILAAYGSRFRTVNLTTESQSELRDVIDALLQYDIFGVLSELSLQVNNGSHYDYGPPDDSDYVIPQDSPLTILFLRLVGQLSALRVSGANFHWNTMAFSSNLHELHIENITLGYDPDVIPFLRALSSASELRHLKIISVTTLYKSLDSSGLHETSSIEFPNLRSLLLQNLYFNTLMPLFPMDIPSTCQSSFTLTYRGLMIHRRNDFGDDEFETEDTEVDGFDSLSRILAWTLTDTLTIVDHCWLQGRRLRYLLNSIPNLKRLKLDCWSLDSDIWENLIRIRCSEADTEDTFPALTNLYLTSARVSDWGRFEQMVTSHPLQKFVLGGTFLKAGTNGPPGHKPLKESDDIVMWPKTKVSIVCLMSSEHHVLEGYPNIWRLW